jgi:four helix bundle protein
MQPYERFGAWQRAHEAALAIHRATRSWPAAERFGLTAEVRRAARSVPTNIVEGSAKHGGAEFRRYLDISLGSLAEVGYLLRFARDLGILDEREWVKLEGMRDQAGKLIWLLYRSLGPRPRKRPAG